MKKQLCAGLLLFTAGIKASERVDAAFLRLAKATEKKEVSAGAIKVHLIQQIEKLDYTLAQVGQAAGNYKAYLANKKVSLPYIVALRNVLKSCLAEDRSVLELLNISRVMTDIVANEISNDFATCAAIDEATLIRPAKELSNEVIEKELLARDTRIANLDYYIDLIGFSTTNRLARAIIDDVNEDYDYSFWIKKSLPYLALGGYWYLSRTQYGEEVKPVRNNNNNNPEPVTYLDKLGETLGSPVKLSIGNVIDLTAAKIFADVVKDDAKDAWAWASEQGTIAKKYLKNEFYFGPPGYMYIPIRLNDITDIVGAESAKVELSRIANYYKDKNIFDRTGAYVERSFLLTGPLFTTELLIYGIAGEISSILKKQGKSKECCSYKVHASALVEKGLDKILKEAEEHAPCIVLLDEIDCFYDSRFMKRDDWSKMTQALYKLSRSKKDVFLVTAAKNANFTTPENLKRFGVHVVVESPTHAERIRFFEDEFRKRAINKDEFDLDTIFRRIDTFEYDQLMTLLYHSLAKAQTERVGLQEKHVVASIDDLLKAYK